jgi:hypothetical protein
MIARIRLVLPRIDLWLRFVIPSKREAWSYTCLRGRSRVAAPAAVASLARWA